MPVTFAPGVSGCIADGRVALLSLPLDRYLMLPAATERCLLRAVAGDSAQPGDERMLDRLVALRLLVRAPPPARPVLCQADDPVSSLLDRQLPRPAAREVLSAAAGVAAAMAQLRARPLARVLRGLPAPTPSTAPSLPTSLGRQAAAFAALRLALRALDRCLPLSIALARRAKRCDPATGLVLGVACNPFAAHAWVQRGATVLNDRLDTIAPFTPILVL